MPRRRKLSNPLKAVAYVRVSTDRQELGPVAQRAQIAAFATSQGIEIVAWYEDIGVSGAADLAKRPGLLAAIARLKPEHAGVLVVAKRDRLARDSYLAATLDRIVEKAGARIFCADGIANGTSPADGLLRLLLDGVGCFERALISQRTKDVLATKKACGERVGGLPYGATVDATRKLVPVASEQATIARVRALRASGLSLRKVVAQLTADGVLSRTGRPFIVTQVVRMAA